MKVNNVEMGDFNIFDYEVIQKYEKALKTLQEKEKKTKPKNIAEMIKEQCGIVFDFFNVLFGEGADKKIFGDKVDLLTCFNVLGDFIIEVNKQSEKISQVTQKYSPDRIKRK